MRTANEFEDAARERGITEWERDPEGCSGCGYSVGYRFAPNGVFYDVGCWCTGRAPNWEPRTWQDVADFYNMQNHPRVIAEMDAFWGFSAVASA